MKKNRRLTSLVNLMAVLALFIAVSRFLASGGGNRALDALLTQVCYNIILVTSLNLVTGVLGELTLGHAGFMSIGAYISAILTTQVLPQNNSFLFPLAMIGGGLAAALVGYLIGIPALRLRGDYLAIITLGFGEIIRVLITTVFAPWTGGGRKMFGITLYTSFGISYWTMALVVALLFMLAWSRHGRAILAIRENEVAADAAGVPVTRYKMMAFTISAFFAGVAGSLYAHSVGVLDPTKFDFNTSIEYLVMVVFGGMGSFTGSIVAATGLTVVQFAMAKLVEYRQLAYALLLIAMMIFRPKGLMGIWEFSLSRLLSRLVPGFAAFAKRAEALLHRRKAGPIMPDMPAYPDADAAPVLELKNLGVRFGGLHAVEDVDIQLSDNEIVGLIGPNGAGKTTVFNLLTGVYTPTEGSVLLLGKRISGRPTYAITNEGVARTFQNIRLFKSMTVIENIKVAFQSRMYYSMWDGALRNTYYNREEEGCDLRARELLRVFDMEHLAEQKASSLPYGQQRKLEICRAMASNPKVLLLDEPAAGMNPTETSELMQTIRLIRERFQVTILLIAHDMKLGMGICERIYVLNYGHVIAQGTPEDIKSNPDVIRAYLGGTGEKEAAQC